MLLLLDTGARVSEIANLKFKDVDFNNGCLHVLGKGNKERIIPFGRRVAKILLRYRVKHRPEPMCTDRFFLISDGRPMTVNRIEHLVRQYGSKAGIERCYCHKFRHTFAVTYLRNGGDVFSLQKILGHSSLEIVKLYVNLADKDVKECHKKFSPADNLDMRSKTSKDDTAVFSGNFDSDILADRPAK
jgi:site-specific recombinase XerD